jgi:hypothetical protein
MGKTFSRNKIDIEIDLCVICLNNVKKTNNTTTILECNHFYHTKCIDIWLAINNVCPYCMQKTIYKPATKEPKLETKTVININQNNVRNKNFYESCCKKKDTYFVFLAMFVIFASIVNIGLMTVVVDNINNNYISDFGNITNITDIGDIINITDITDIGDIINITDYGAIDNITDYDDNVTDIGDSTDSTECIENKQNKTNINIVVDYIIQGVYTFYLFILPGVSDVKNKYIFFSIIILSFMISYGLNIYRFVLFNYYLDLMKEIDYCDNITHNIQVQKTFLLIQIIILGISLPIYVVFNIAEYFHRKKINN